MILAGIRARVARGRLRQVVATVLAWLSSHNVDATYLSVLIDPGRALLGYLGINRSSTLRKSSGGSRR